MARHRGCSLQRRLRQCGNVAGASGRIGCEQAVFLIGDGSVGWSRRRRRKRREQQGGGGGCFFSGVGVMWSAETVERRQEGADRWSVRDSIRNCRRVLLASGAGISCCGNCCAEIDAESLQQNIRIPLVLTPKVESRAGQDRRASLCDSNHSATFKKQVFDAQSLSIAEGSCAACSRLNALQHWQPYFYRGFNDSLFQSFYAISLETDLEVVPLLPALINGVGCSISIR